MQAGGHLEEVRDAEPMELHANLVSLMKQSDEVLLVHIVRNSCQISPSGEQPITIYQAVVLRKWKGPVVQDVVYFAVPMGHLQFDKQTSAISSVHGFHPLVNGKRYVLFLRFARDQERQLTPARRLTGSAVQGAFRLEDEKVMPAYELDKVARKYSRMSVAQFLEEVQTLAARD
jgi:hypothetical protein